MEDIKKKLTEELEVVSWDALLPHFDRGATIKVSNTLDLIEVGIAMANDNSEIVGEWLKAGLLSQPSKEDSKTWTEQKNQFQFIIVQPYVLVQEIALHS